MLSFVIFDIIVILHKEKLNYRTRHIYIYVGWWEYVLKEIASKHVSIKNSQERFDTDVGKKTPRV